MYPVWSWRSWDRNRRMGLAEGHASLAEGQVMSHGNLLADTAANLPDKLFTTLLDAANVRIERTASQGPASPEGFWHDQHHHQRVKVLKGTARSRLEDER